MNASINRRTLIAGAIAAPAILSFSRHAKAATTTLTLGHNAAMGNPRVTAADRFAELVGQRSNGRLAVRVGHAEQLGNEQSLLTSLRTGAIDMTVNSTGSVSALVPEVAAVGLPFIFPNSAAGFRVLDGPVGKELGSFFPRVGMVSLGWWDNGIRHIVNGKRPINEPADLKGLKIRTPPDPMTIDIFRSLGAATEQISFGELYIALQQGVVDGAENALPNIASSKLFEVSRFISLSAHKWECSPFLISQITWARLSDADKDVITSSAKDSGDLQRKLMAEEDTKYLAVFEANSALAVNQVDMPAFQKAAAPVFEIWRAKPYGAFVDRLVAAAQA